jgi:hypothetical protein
LALLLAATTVAPAVAASTELLQVDVVSQSVSATGPNNIDGALAVFLRGAADNGVVAPASFSATGGHIHVTTYTLNPTTYPLDVHQEVQTDHQDFDHATVEGIVNRAGYQAAVFPTGPVSISLQSPCSELKPSGRERVERLSQVYSTADSDSTMAANTAQALQWASCTKDEQTGTLQLHGDFLLMLWEWDSQATSNNHTVFLPSGRDRYELDPIGSPQTRSVVSHDRQQYLYVTDGAFTIQTGLDPTEQLYLNDVVARTESSFTLKRPQGKLTDGIQVVGVDAGEMTVAGAELSLQGRGAETPFHATTSAVPSEISIDGQPLQFTSTTSPLVPVWGWLAGFGAVLAPAVAIPLARRRHSRSRVEPLLHTSSELATCMQYRAAAALTAKAVDLAAHMPRAQFFHAVALGGQGDTAGARRHHDQVRRLLRAAPNRDLLGENAFQAALTLTRSQAPHETVLECLLEAIHAKPALLDEMERHGEFRPYRRQVWAAVENASLLQP